MTPLESWIKYQQERIDEYGLGYQSININLSSLLDLATKINETIILECEEATRKAIEP